MTRAVMSIDPRLIALVGRNQYSSNPLPIIVRELLQNSIDACTRKGIEPSIRITVRSIHDSYDDWLVTCEDNGIGMTAEQIVSDFLCLGGVKDDATGQTGGFGIAKAVIMGCENWSVKSLDNFVSRDILLAGDDIQKRKHREGTKVAVRIREGVYGSSLRKMLQMIYYSDVNIYLRLKTDRYPLIDIEDSHAGFPAIERKLLDENVDFNLYGTGAFEIDHIDLSNVSEVGGTGWNVVRLNGLMQMLRGTVLDYRKTNLFFDIKTDKEPEHSEYPFSMNRESLKGGYQELVDAFVASHNANVVQSIVAVNDDTPDEEKIEVLPGRMLSGSRATTYDRHERSNDSGMGNKTDADFVIEEKMRRLREGSKVPVRMLIRRYERNPEKRAWHAKVLLAWQDVLQLVAELDESFGIGITSVRYHEAARFSMDGDVYYIINPDAAITEDLREQSPQAIVLSLWALASHEVTHKYVDDHNEWFTTTENNIMRDSAEVILQALRTIAKRLL